MRKGSWAMGTHTAGKNEEKIGEIMLKCTVLKVLSHWLTVRDNRSAYVRVRDEIHFGVVDRLVLHGRRHVRHSALQHTIQSPVPHVIYI